MNKMVLLSHTCHKKGIFTDRSITVALHWCWYQIKRCFSQLNTCHLNRSLNLEGQTCVTERKHSHKPSKLLIPYVNNLNAFSIQQNNTHLFVLRRILSVPDAFFSSGYSTLQHQPHWKKWGIGLTCSLVSQYIKLKVLFHSIFVPVLCAHY